MIKLFFDAAAHLPQKPLFVSKIVLLRITSHQIVLEKVSRPQQSVLRLFKRGTHDEGEKKWNVQNQNCAFNSFTKPRSTEHF